MCLLIVALAAAGGAPDLQAKPLTQIGELVDWDPNRTADLPKTLSKADPNAVIIAKETLSVLPDMFTKMETVILHLTAEGTHARLDELLTSIQPDAKKGRPAAPASVRAFVLAQIKAKLEVSGAAVPVAELEVLIEAVEGGPVKEFVVNLRQQGAEVSLSELLTLVEKSPDAIRAFYLPTVMTHLEHGHLGMVARFCGCESEDPWSVPLTDLSDRGTTQPKAVQDYVRALPVWLAKHRIEREAPDVPIHQLLEMLANSRKAYAKMIARPLVVEKDLQAPSKVAYLLQEAYARSEQINSDLVGRNVIGVIAVGTLLVLLSFLRGYIKVLDIPNRRITE
jgi:hypothetical protein